MIWWWRSWWVLCINRKREPSNNSWIVCWTLHASTSSTSHLHASTNNQICVHKRSFPQDTYLISFVVERKQGHVILSNWWHRPHHYQQQNDIHAFLIHTIFLSLVDTWSKHLILLSKYFFSFCDPGNFLWSKHQLLQTIMVNSLCSTRLKISAAILVCFSVEGADVTYNNSFEN